MRKGVRKVEQKYTFYTFWKSIAKYTVGNTVEF